MPQTFLILFSSPLVLCCDEYDLMVHVEEKLKYLRKGRKKYF